MSYIFVPSDSERMLLALPARHVGMTDDSHVLKPSVCCCVTSGSANVSLVCISMKLRKQGEVVEPIVTILCRSGIDVSHSKQFQW